MKAFVALFALVAAVAAEADPALVYSGLGYSGLGYSGLGYSGLGYSRGLGYSGLGYANTLGYGYGSPLIGALAAPAALPAVPGGYAAAGRYVANSAGVVHVAKRSAEADADAEADPGLLYSGLGYSGLGYSGLGYSNLGYASGLGYSAGLPLAYSHGLIGKSSECVNAYNQAVPCANRHVAVVAPYSARLWKREAEAESEADPAYFATGLGYSGLGYSGLGYAGLGYSNLGYSGLGYNGLGYAAGLPYASGLVHTSRLGVCLNNQRQQVPC